MVGIAWALSGVIHGSILAASYFVPWSPQTATKPKIHLARGVQAVQVTILFTPWPEPADIREPPPADAKQALSEKIVEVTSIERPPTLKRSGENQPVHRPPRAVENRPPSAPASDSRRHVADADTLIRQRVPAGDNGLEQVHSLQQEKPVDQDRERILAQEAVVVFSAVDAEQDSPSAFDGKPPNEVARQEPTETHQTFPTSLPTAQTLPSAVGERPRAASTVRQGAATGARLVNLPRPTYPWLSRRRGEEGLVLLQVEVLPDGTVGEVKVLRDPGFARLTAAAISAARKARFTPATRDGQPVRTVVQIPFRFVLR